MQIVHKNEVEGNVSRRAGAVSSIICAGGIGGRMERKCNLESGEVEYESVEEFLTSLRKEFGGGEEESVKVAELRRIEQGGKTMEKYVQEFKRTVRGSRYERRPLVEEFKRGMNGGIRRKLMEAENPLASIEQWYRRVMVLDRNWRESRREEERLREKKE